MSDEAVKMNFDALDDLLEAERDALLKGDLEKLTSMLPRKEALIDALNEGIHTDLSTLESLDKKVRRNQLLLDGAMEGIRNVAQRLAELRRLRGSLETYGSDGKKRNIDVDADHTVEKRA
ncbi:MAG: flagellar biosynthesis protein FlgN [Sulfitobacter sp.]